MARDSGDSKSGRLSRSSSEMLGQVESVVKGEKDEV